MNQEEAHERSVFIRNVQLPNDKSESAIVFRAVKIPERFTAPRGLRLMAYLQTKEWRHEK